MEPGYRRYFPSEAKSHYSVYEPLLKRLSARGHEIVAVTHFPQRTRLTNLTDVDVSSTLPSMIGTLYRSPPSRTTIWRNIRHLTRSLGVEICEPVLNHSKEKRIIDAKGTLRLARGQNFWHPSASCPCLKHTESDRGVIKSVALRWSNKVFRNPENPSYIPNWFSWGYTR